MPNLYVDDFRGFKDTYLDLGSVNFLVGENSTGKTSILSLLHVLSDPKFLFEGELRTEHVDYNRSSDIISSRRGTKQSFIIGLYEDSFPPSAKRKGNDCSVLVMWYKNRKGNPILEQMCCVQRGYILRALIESEVIYYSSSEYSGKGNPKNQVKKFVNEGILEKATLKELIRMKDYPLPSSLVTALNVLTLESISKRGSNRSISFSFVNLFPSLIFFAPIRAKAKRTYDESLGRFTSEGNHTPYLLQKYLVGNISNRVSRRIERELKLFGKNSGLFSKIHIEQLGRGEGATFELHVFIEGSERHISNVGYGISQVLPVVVESLSRSEGTWFAIQQPEVHLHPRAQAALGDFLFRAHINRKQNFLIETHSEYLVNRFRLNISQHKADIDAQVLFFERRGSENKVRQIPIGPQGRFIGNIPQGYRNFYVKEELSLLELV